jgi:uracil-DNA glycosylase
LSEFVAKERSLKLAIYPAPDAVFSAFNNSPFARTRVVIIGQDPYHGPHQAHGMSFSVARGVAIPPSLRNIYKELTTDVPGWTVPKHGNLETWARQGVLLLNSVMTVEGGKPNSHKGRGWERFTDGVVAAVNKRQGKGCVFMLWGAYAEAKGIAINAKKHCVLRSAHPSPLSANRGFFGCGHFSKANDFLSSTNQATIDWTVPRQ